MCGSADILRLSRCLRSTPRRFQHLLTKVTEQLCNAAGMEALLTFRRQSPAPKPNYSIRPLIRVCNMHRRIDQFEHADRWKQPAPAATTIVTTDRDLQNRWQLHQL